MNVAARTVSTSHPGLLDLSVRGVMLVFNFSNPKLLDPWMWGNSSETKKSPKQSLLDRRPGVQFIDDAVNISLAGFIEDLRAAGYWLVDASAEALSSVADKSGLKPHCRACYIFGREPVELDPDYANLIEHHYESSLARLVDESHWAVRAFRNHVGETFGLSINCGARTPPQMTWKTNEAGERVGEHPVMLLPKPNGHLRVVDGCVDIATQ